MIVYNNVFSGGKTKDNIVKVTYAELVALGAAKNFDTSVVYQLTDYEAIDGWTEGLTQKFSNNGKRFDILLTATSNEFLSCSAGATKHDGNNSFSEINNLTIKQAVAYTTFKHLSDKDITVESHHNKSVIYQSAENTVITL